MKYVRWSTTKQLTKSWKDLNGGKRNCRLIAMLFWSESVWPLKGTRILGLHVLGPWGKTGTDTVCSKTINPDCKFILGEHLKGYKKRAMGGWGGRKTRHPGPERKPHSRPSVSGFPGDRSRASVCVGWPCGSSFTTALPSCDLFSLLYFFPLINFGRHCEKMQPLVLSIVFPRQRTCKRVFTSPHWSQNFCNNVILNKSISKTERHNV